MVDTRRPSKVGRRRADESAPLEVRISGRYKDLIEGRIPIESLDNEELARCQLKDKNGRFTGKPPTFLPRSLVLRMQREFFKRGDDLFSQSYVTAVQTMVRTMTDPLVDPAVQLKAAQYVIERVRGKTPDLIAVVDAEKPWQVLLQKIVVRPDELEPSDDVIDAEVIE